VRYSKSKTPNHDRRPQLIHVISRFFGSFGGFCASQKMFLEGRKLGFVLHDARVIPLQVVVGYVNADPRVRQEPSDVVRAGCVTVVALVRSRVAPGGCVLGPLHLAAPWRKKPGENSGRFAEEPSLPQTSEAIGSGARVLLER